MSAYIWGINGKEFSLTDKPQVIVKPGKRALISYVNETGMSHPMHFHGHTFQVIKIGDKPLHGALRDSVLVTPFTTVTIAFDADNPGLWFTHCHIAWHAQAGMATTVKYES